MTTYSRFSATRFASISLTMLSMNYDQTFDWFEYMLGLVSCDVGKSRDTLAKLKEQDANFLPDPPVGRLAWKSWSGGGDIRRETDLRKGELMPEKVAALIRLGFSSPLASTKASSKPSKRPSMGS